ncbi:DUF2953 domain-containing protein [Methanobrevibacter gottschalkii]|uniref:DUF2953 domain-containing protein n=1 Tax=Methanobrevibacter gottschalkii TaxID=190974 RepID=UPI0026F12524|nr:DUF2953 domain-containing protein [Methanobrevibacter gottschalkii]
MIISIIILFIIILLYFGVKISLIYDKKGPEFEGCLQISILRKIKVFSKDFLSSQPAKKEDKKDEEEPKEEEESGEDKKDDKKELFKLAKPCFSHFVEFLKSAMKCIRVEKLENHLIFGMDSYVETAKYIGYIWSLMIIVNSSHKNAKLSAQPSFNGSILDGNGDNELEINILKLIPPVIRLVLKKEVRTLIKGAIK